MQETFGARLKKLFHICQDEVKKTTEISKKMLSASKTSSELSEVYQDLGALVYKDLKQGVLEWTNPKAKKLVKAVEEYENNLQTLEDDVATLKSKNH